MNEQRDRNKPISSTNLILRVIFSVISLLILLYLFYLFFEFGANPILIIFILLFTILLFLGPIYKKDKKTLYSKIFPDKKTQLEALKRQYTSVQKQQSQEDEPRYYEKRKIPLINLEVKYHKQLLSKCENCGFLIVSSAKKCPKCGKSIKH